MSQFEGAFLLVVVFLTAYLYFRITRSTSPFSRLPLPPGPRKLPLIGNLLDMPRGYEWITYHKLCQEYDTDILHLNVFGMNIVILDTSTVAIDLLEKRSSIYSSRPCSPMIMELMGWNFNMGLMEYGQKWRDRRRLMHESFHPIASTFFRPHIKKATRDLLLQFLDAPENDVITNIESMASQLILSAGYGVDVLPQNDPYVEIIHKAIRPLIQAAVPGAFLVDFLHILKYVPEWMPGAGFKRKAREWNEWKEEMVEKPYAASKKLIESGTYYPSFVSTHLLSKTTGCAEEDVGVERVIKDVAGTLYSGATDSTTSALGSCILGLVENPQIIRKAQEELDRVLKPGHLPGFEDMDSLPYITAIVKETLRWRPVAPMSVPHLTTVEDEYKGYRIPAGSIIIPNAWAMLLDENVYPDPLIFNPDRFMEGGKINKSVRDPSHACFGFGRRICPARFFAFQMLWINIASILTTFDIKKPLDEQGNVVPLAHDYETSLVWLPKPYKCRFIPRFKDTEELIRSSIIETSAL